MADATDVVLNDAQATPVAHTFVPIRVTPDFTSFADRSPGVSLGFRQLKVSTSFGNGQRTTDKTELRLDVPVVQTVDGVAKLAHVNRGLVQFVFSQQATEQERKDLYKYITEALANSLLIGALRDLDPVH